MQPTTVELLRDILREAESVRARGTDDVRVISSGRSVQARFRPKHRDCAPASEIMGVI